MTNRELDAQVAEKVMGWKKLGEWRYSWENAEGTHVWLPLFGKEMSAAWLVVEKMREQDYDVTIAVRPKLEYGCRIAPRCEFNTPSVIFKSAPTAPEAICLAALKAVENGV